MKTILKSMKKLLLVVVVFTAVAFSGNHGIPATVEVQVVGFQFIPSTVTVQAGDTVRWLFIGGGHSVTSGTNCTPDGMWNSGILGAGSEFSVVFDTPGTFPYYCIPHCLIGMVGTVVVSDAEQPFEGTGIQVTGLSSDISGNVMAGDTVTFTVSAITAVGVGPLNYRFFSRKGYESIADEANPWGGNPWIRAHTEPWITDPMIPITFDESGFFFVAVHLSEDTTWSAADGGPQTGMVVEVWAVD